ncbi:MAG: ATP-dependent helicase [Deltaproteobacteria bacterium]|nr:ATP-dependent helicase [Deltaproteobacteria bacterium]
MREYTIRREALPAKDVAFLTELNDEQRAAVTAESGPTLVLAGAGTGKTRVVTYRVAWFIAQGTPPERILLVTFTNKAARAMLERVEKLVGGDVRKLWGGTFHHVGNRLLRDHGEQVGLAPGFGILDREDARDLLEACVSELGLGAKGRRFPKGDVLLDIISASANRGLPIESIILDRAQPFWHERAAIEDVAAQYERRKRAMNVVDFDDLLTLWLRLLDDASPARAALEQQFDAILVDEYQDVNRLQGDIVDRMAAAHRNVTVVGDDAQSIYSFRGASFETIMEFPDRYPEARVVRLTQNYRSTPEILRLANAVIAQNKNQFPKELAATQESGSTPAVLPLRDAALQADFVCQRVLELREEGVPLESMAVLYRAHHHAMELQMELARRGIPFRVLAGLRFFEQAHVKDVLAHLRVLHNPREELSWLRVLKLQEGIGPATADRLYQTIRTANDPVDAVAHGLADTPGLSTRARRGTLRLAGLFDALRAAQKPDDLVSAVLQGGYSAYLRVVYPNSRDREDDIAQLATYAGGFPSLEVFLTDLSLVTNLEAERVVRAGEKDEALTLASVHQAKGLEWRAVFVIWLADGRFPSAQSMAHEAALEEERRLFYVAVTRAREEVYLTYPLTHTTRDYRQVILQRSPFIAEIDRGDDSPFETWRITTATEPAPRLDEPE